MTTKKLFYKEELLELPLSYENMISDKTINIKELRIGVIYGKSDLHQTDQYMILLPTKPFSNCIIEK